MKGSFRRARAPPPLPPDSPGSASTSLSVCVCCERPELQLPPPRCLDALGAPPPLAPAVTATLVSKAKQRHPNKTGDMAALTAAESQVVVRWSVHQ